MVLLPDLAQLAKLLRTVLAIPFPLPAPKRLPPKRRHPTRPPEPSLIQDLLRWILRAPPPPPHKIPSIRPSRHYLSSAVRPLTDTAARGRPPLPEIENALRPHDRFHHRENPMPLSSMFPAHPRRSRRAREPAGIAMSLSFRPRFPKRRFRHRPNLRAVVDGASGRRCGSPKSSGQYELALPNVEDNLPTARSDETSERISAVRTSSSTAPKDAILPAPRQGLTDQAILTDLGRAAADTTRTLLSIQPQWYHPSAVSRLLANTASRAARRSPKARTSFARTADLTAGTNPVPLSPVFPVHLRRSRRAQEPRGIAMSCRSARDYRDRGVGHRPDLRVGGDGVSGNRCFSLRISKQRRPALPERKTT